MICGPTGMQCGEPAALPRSITKAAWSQEKKVKVHNLCHLAVVFVTHILHNSLTFVSFSSIILFWSDEIFSIPKSMLLRIGIFPTDIWGVFFENAVLFLIFPMSSGFLLASGNRNHSIKLWDSHTNSFNKSLIGHTDFFLYVRKDNIR